MTTLCIFHGNCADGFGSAWVVRKAMAERGGRAIRSLLHGHTEGADVLPALR